MVNQEKAQPDKGWAKLVEEIKQKATKENVTQQIILKKKEGEEFRYTVSLMANPGRTPFVALSVVRIAGRGRNTAIKCRRATDMTLRFTC